jgi:hypothetical protein
MNLHQSSFGSAKSIGKVNRFLMPCLVGSTLALGGCMPLWITLNSAAETDAVTDAFRHRVRWLIPENYGGWVRIYYNVEGAPELVREGSQTLVTIPPSGILETSSPGNYGWGVPGCEKNATEQYFYYDSNGEPTEALRNCPEEDGMIWGISTGRIGDVQVEHFFVGTQEEFERNRSPGIERCFGGMRQADGSLQFSEVGRPEFHIPNQYVGRVYIRFGVEETPQLESDPDPGRLIIDIPVTGKAITATERPFSGPPLKCNPDWPQFFYVEAGQRVQALPEKGANTMIRSFRLGGGGGYNSAWFFVGTAAEYRQYGGERIYGGIRQPDGSVIFHELE